MKEGRYGEGDEGRKVGRDEVRKVWRRRGKEGSGGAKGGAKEERIYLNMYIVYCILYKKEVGV